MKLRNAILSGLLFGIAHGVAVNAEPTKGYYTMDAMGCMLLGNALRILKDLFF